jgi:hypothetical protein
LDPSEGSKKDEGTGESQKKLPYEPPRILYRQAIEAIAAVCDDPGKPDTIVCSFQGS